MLHRAVVLTLSALVLGSSVAGRAEPAPDLAEPPLAPGLAQGDNALMVGAEFGWGQGATVMYERTIYRFFGVRAGYSAMLLPTLCINIFGACDGTPEFTAAHGPSVDLVFRTLGEHAFEASVGATMIFGWADEDPLVLPDLFLGYRYQPKDSPIFVRAGLGTKGLLTGPLEASVGFRF